MRAAVVLVAMALVNGCAGEEVEEKATTLRLPEASAVTRVQTSDNHESLSAITEPEAITKVLEELRGLAAGWQLTVGQNPPFTYATGFSSADKATLLVLWTGEDWLAAYPMEDKLSFRQTLVDPERKRLLRSLGISTELEAEAPLAKQTP